MRKKKAHSWTWQSIMFIPFPSSWCLSRIDFSSAAYFSTYGSCLALVSHYAPLIRGFSGCSQVRHFCRTQIKRGTLHYAGVVLFNSDKSGYRDKTKKTPEGHVYQGVTKILDLATPSVDFVNTLQRLRGVAAPVYRKNLLQKMLF
jgi:hypothetical protein